MELGEWQMVFKIFTKNSAVKSVSLTAKYHKGMHKVTQRTSARLSAELCETLR